MNKVIASRKLRVKTWKMADEPLADEEWLKKYEKEVDETNKLEQELREDLKGQFKWILGK